MTADGIIYAEVFYDDAWVAWYGLRIDGAVVATDDEEAGRNRQFQRPSVEMSAVPETLQRSHPLNYAGPRLRGSRQLERVDDLTYPLDVSTKMRLVEVFHLPMMPMQLLGLAESSVLSQATFPADELQLVCRRLRLAYALTAPQTDPDGEPYDYDTVSIYQAHRFQPSTDEDLINTLFEGLPGPAMSQPTDVMVTGTHVLIAESSDDQQMCQVHVWDVPPQ
jgi:hypothetical protein